MCGIFGIININKKAHKDIKRLINELFLLSESRGKDASGFALIGNSSIKVFKEATAASTLIKSNTYKNTVKEYLKEKNDTTCLIGHARMVTNGTMAENNNNQPVIKDGLVAIHNGIVVNDELLWKKFTNLERNYQVDTEVSLALLRKFLKEHKSIKKAAQKMYEQIRGAASLAVVLEDYNYLLLTTNTGSIYYIYDEKNKIFIFASEQYFLASLVKNKSIKNKLQKNKIYQLKAGNGLLVDLETCQNEVFSLKTKLHDNTYKLKTREIVDISPPDDDKKQKVTLIKTDLVNLEQEVWRNYDRIQARIFKLRRCTKCILPETMPFIVFDESGVCNYCKLYQRMKVLGEEKLFNDVRKYRSKNGKPDCIVAFSGGRDSSYGLHYIKNVLKMNPVAYSYDWGMLTDLGRRNQSIMTADLGVEHILISADITKKREYIKKNVEAWLKDPDLGTVPLFMAGDKQYFYYANLLKKQMEIDLVFLCENPLEKTDFKSGFCGIKPSEQSQEKYYALSLQKKLQMAFYYGKKYLKNPSYINSSLLDTIDAFISYYFIPHDYLSLYKYIKWEEKNVDNTLLKKYDWELAEDTSTTWRIGDGTAALYNFIYYTMAGFSENDTFRSNQIREGQLTRDKALTIANKDNEPRFESLLWYSNTIGLDFKKLIISIINAPKLKMLK